MKLKVLDKTLKGIRGVRLDNQKVFSAPGPRNKLIERFFIFQKAINCASLAKQHPVGSKKTESLLGTKNRVME